LATPESYRSHCLKRKGLGLHQTQFSDEKPSNPEEFESRTPEKSEISPPVAKDGVVLGCYDFQEEVRASASENVDSAGACENSTISEDKEAQQLNWELLAS
jgi:hypothetical protein